MSPATVTSIDRTQPSLADLLDTLYEILASGLEPEGAAATTDDIEAFLHQHARSPKGRIEVEAFFQNNGLPTQLERFPRDSSVRIASISSLPMTPAPASAPLQVAPVPRSLPPAVPVAITPRDRSAVRIWGAVAVLCAAVLLTSVLGALAMLNVREQVARTEANQRALLAAIATLKNRTEQVDTRLDAQAKVVDSTRTQIDRLVESFLPVAE